MRADSACLLLVEAGGEHDIELPAQLARLADRQWVRITLGRSGASVWPANAGFWAGLLAGRGSAVVMVFVADGKFALVHESKFPCLSG